MSQKMVKAESSQHDLNIAKISSIFILGFSALLCTLLPIVLTRYLGRRHGSKRVDFKARMDSILNLFLRFGGGILLATTFIHLLPEVREDMANTIDSSWPISELVMCGGFFIMYATEEVAHLLLHQHHGHSHNHDHDDEFQTHQNSIEHGGHNHIVNSSPLRGILITIALSTHQVFEGMAIGLEPDLEHVWVLLGAVAVHKLVLALCVGAELASSPVSFFAGAACVCMFAIASPIGIGIGIAVMSSSQNGDNQTLNTVSVILQGLATGTLMYAVFFEVLTKTNGYSKMGLIYCLVTIVGFAIMVCLLIFFDS